MTTQFLVINDNESAVNMSFDQRLRLFNDPEDAIKHAESLGFRSFFGDLKINRKPGLATVYLCGPIRVTVLALEAK